MTENHAGRSRSVGTRRRLCRSLRPSFGGRVAAALLPLLLLCFVSPAKAQATGRDEIADEEAPSAPEARTPPPRAPAASATDPGPTTPDAASSSTPRTPLPKVLGVFAGSTLAATSLYLFGASEEKAKRADFACDKNTCPGSVEPLRRQAQQQQLLGAGIGAVGVAIILLSLLVGGSNESKVSRAHVLPGARSIDASITF